LCTLSAQNIELPLWSGRGLCDDEDSGISWEVSWGPSQARICAAWLHKQHGIALWPERFGQGQRGPAAFRLGKLHKSREIPKKNLSGEIEKELTGRETEAWEIRFCELRAAVEELGGETLVALFPAIVICGAALIPIASTGSLRRIFEGFRSGETIRESLLLNAGRLRRKHRKRA
jgi:hypothetical protein